MNDEHGDKPYVKVHSEQWWFEVITGIRSAETNPNKKGRLFGPRTEQHPI